MNWKRVTKKILSKYRHKLAVEEARTAATREALRMMIAELADALVSPGTLQEIDEDWPEDDDSGEKSN